MNATVQALASLWPLVTDISSDDVRDGLQDESLLAALIDLLSEMGKGGAVSPVRFSGIALKALAFEEGRQQDAHEFLLAALNHMDGETDKRYEFFWLFLWWFVSFFVSFSVILVSF